MYTPAYSLAERVMQELTLALAEECYHNLSRAQTPALSGEHVVTRTKHAASRNQLENYTMFSFYHATEPILQLPCSSIQEYLESSLHYLHHKFITDVNSHRTENVKASTMHCLY